METYVLVKNVNANKESLMKMNLMEHKYIQRLKDLSLYYRQELVWFILGVIIGGIIF
jgi:hypothetical protein